MPISCEACPKFIYDIFKRPARRKRKLKTNFNPDDFKSLKALCHTGGYCSSELKQAWINILGAKNVYEIYSMSEMIGMTVIRGDEWVEHPGSVGNRDGHQ